MSNSRILWLVVFHAVLVTAPLFAIGFQFGMQLLLLEWTLSSLPLGSLMTLSIWIGLGRMRALRRVAIGLAAVFYLTIFPMIVDVAHSTEYWSVAKWIMNYLENAAQITILLVVLGGTFLLIGRWFELARFESNAGPVRSERLQFSMLQIMLVMSAVAIVLSLVRLTRAASGHRPSTWETVIICSFMFVAFIVNTACATFATLGAGKVTRNVVLVLFVAVLLGVATAIALHNETVSWWFFAGSMLIMIVPTVVVLASLLVVRSCGYRLIRRGSETATGLL